jgi:hypothetical protein
MAPCPHLQELRGPASNRSSKEAEVGMVGRGRRSTVAVWLVAVALVLGIAHPANGAGTGDVTGDITEPTLVSLTVAPAAGDVTDGPVSFTVRVRATDDFSGLQVPSLSRTNLERTWAYGINLTQVAGDDRDATWTGTFTIPQGAAPGRYPLWISISDRVGNGRFYTPEDLAARGHASGVDVSDSRPDATPPDVRSLTVTPDPVDTRGGPAHVTVSMRITDTQSGVKGMVVFLMNPAHTSGGTEHPFFRLQSGSPMDGVWTGTGTLPEHTPAGRWVLEVRVHDELDNQRTYAVADLDRLGLTSGFSVLSDEDLDAPRIPEASIWPIEVNVHDADQQVRVRVRATDAVTGIQQPWSGSELYNVQASAWDPVFRQSSGIGLMPRTSGDAHDGWYESSLTINKSSATGLRAVTLWAMDAVGNTRTVQGADLIAAGAAPAVLVYNTPLPPLPIDAIGGDASAIVRWLPPLDDRGAAVTEYVVRSGSGVEVRVPGDARSAVVRGLANGQAQRFEILAVNKAGPSDPSSPLSATPAVAAATVPPSGDAAPASGGYRMVTRAGVVHAFGAAGWLGNAAVGSTPAVDLASTPTGGGYWVVDAAGHVFSFGDAPWLGGAPPLRTGETVTSISGTPTGRGYWIFTTRGRVLSFGDAPWLGDMAGTRLNGPVLDSVPTPSGLGYYLVASDGGVFTFGDAAFAGSMGATALNAPVRSLVPDPDGGGYWLVAADGGIFSFDAPFHGSMGDVRLNRPIAGMVGSPTGGGYLMVGEDGGIFTFGDVAFHGSLGASPPPVPVVAVAAD